jgi:phosphatidylglycerol lysyltransferase
MWGATWRRLPRWLAALVPIAILAAALFIVHRELSTQQLSRILDSARSIPSTALALALTITAASYLVLSLYDFLGLRYVGKRLSSARIVFTSFIAYAVSHTLNLASVTGAAIRYRFYQSDGLTVGDVARVTVFNALTLATGFALIAGCALAAAPKEVAAALAVEPVWARALGILMIAAVATYVIFASRQGRVLRIRKWELKAPGARLALLQPLIGVVDLTLASAVLWTLLPSEMKVGFISFAGIYALASMAGVISAVPAGIGVFESVMLLLLPQVPVHELAGSLIAYRVIYYLVPLSIAGVLFAGRELVAQRARLALMKRAAETYLGSIVPEISAVAVFLAALVLLLSGATQGIDARLAVFEEVFPLPVLELSHLAGSAIGVALLILARALLRRVRAAWHISVGLLIAGIVASVLKGFRFEEAAFLAAVLALLWVGRKAFYRSSALLHERFTPGWIASVAAAIALVICVGLIVHREVPYSHDMWWTFAFHEDAPRTLRGSLTASILAGGFLFANLLGPPHRSLAIQTQLVADKVRGALTHATTSLAQAVLAGDKRVLVSDSGNAFIMYQVAGRSWVALGDPVGEAGEHQDLAWRFRELSDRDGGWTVFYQVTGEQLPMYLDLGLTAVKLGEEARVPLATFSLDGSARAEIRQAHRRVARSGATFEIVPAASSGALLSQLSAISDAWLDSKSTAEKRFSIGSYSDDYVRQFPIALVRSGGAAVAFANIWTTPSKQEVSVDLMRFDGQAPHGAMDYLFVELMLWARAQGYSWFNLGMAPLAGLGTHRLAPMWHRLGNFVFRHGEHFYNFEGLRQYKAKYHPTWEPRYLMAPGGLAVPRILTDISILIAGGVRELIAK